MIIRFAFIYWIFLIPVFSEEGSGTAKLMGDMEQRLSYLEDVVSDLRGKLEESEKKIKDLSVRPIHPPAGPGGEAHAPSPPHHEPSSLTPGVVLPEPGQSLEGATIQSENQPQKLYDEARSFLNKQAYRDAEIAFKDLVALYPKHVLVINSKYWLGEIYLSRGEYHKASVSLAEAYTLYKKQGEKGSYKGAVPLKAPEALLKLAFSLRGQGKNEEVCATLDQMKKEFPDVYGAKKTIVDRAKAGLKCAP